jgi:hypothetical protein
MSEAATVGLRAKTGRAIGIAISGGIDAPRFAGRRELQLYDPLVPASGQPHHAVMELPWSEAQLEVRKFVAVIERCAASALKSWLRDLRADGFNVRRIGIAGAPERNLERIGNYHIRAHAAEGVVFRHALEVAATRNGLAYRTIAERSLNEIVAAELGDVAETMRVLGRSAGRPWRADERAAAAVALLPSPPRAKAGR